MASLSHSSSLSQSSLPFSRPGTASSSGAVIRHHASVDIVPWIVYEHAGNDTESLNDGQETIRVVGRGGLGSRPHRRRTVSATSRTAVPQSHAKTSGARNAPSECSSSDIKPIRVVGRGGYGSKPRILDSCASKESTLNPSGPASTTPAPEKQVLRIGGRGGAGSRPRAFKPKETKGKRFSWLEKGKAKLRFSRPTPPATVSESDDDSSIEFAPMPQSPKPAVVTSVAPSATLDDYPDTPTATFASATTSSDFSPSFQTQSSRRLNKIGRTLGQPFPQDVAFMSIKAPVLKPVSDRNPILAQDHSLSQPLSSTHTFPYDGVLAHSRRYSDSFSIQATGSQRDSSFVEAAYVDDRFEATSTGGTSSRLSPMSFSEPQITQPEREIPDGEGQSPTLFVSYHYPEEPPHRTTLDTPFSQYYKPSSDLESVHDLEIDRAQTWSGRWNADMKHVLASLRQLH